MEKEEDLPHLNLDLLQNNRFGNLSESVRRSIPEATLCSMFCGGRNCKYEDPSRWKQDLQAIQGLYSSWITKNILAMSRPNTKLIKDNKIIEQFKKFKIKTVMNLQSPGEHSSCGPALEPSGFSYDPQDFMKEGVSFYNFAWKDYGFGSISNIMDIVHVMQFAISEGRIAVHCHAGLGRTGLLIACYLIYSNRLDSNAAIQYVRSKRPGSIQTITQIKCVQDFASYLRPLRVIFSSVSKTSGDFTLSQFLSRQKSVIHGLEARQLKFLPKIIFICCERILQLAERSCKNAEHQVNWLAVQSRLTASKMHLASSDASGSASRPLKQNSTETVMESLDLSAVHHSLSLESFTPIRPIHRSVTTERLNASYLTHPKNSYDWNSYYHETSLDNGQQVPHKMSQNASKGTVLKKRRDSSISCREMVADLMGRTQYAANRREKIDEYKEELNNNSGIWQKLRGEVDVLVLSSLIWEWMDHLQEPILGAQDLPILLQYLSDPLKGLEELEKGASTIIRLLAHVVACLQPISSITEMALIQRALSTLTHQNMVLELETTEESPDDIIPLRTTNDCGHMRSSVAMKLVLFFKNLVKLRRNSLCSCLTMK